MFKSYHQYLYFYFQKPGKINTNNKIAFLTELYHYCLNCKFINKKHYEIKKTIRVMKLPWHLSRSYGVLVSDCLRCRGASIAWPLGSPCKRYRQPQRWHCHLPLRDPSDLRASATDNHNIGTAISVRARGSPVALYKTSLRCYGDLTATPLPWLRSYQNAERQRLFYACSNCSPSLGALCDPNASTGDATALLQRCLRAH